MNNHDISSFITWWLSEIYRMGVWIVNSIDSIKLTQNVSLLDFIITLAIIGVFIGIILTLPQNVNRYERNYENEKEKQARAEERKKYRESRGKKG